MASSSPPRCSLADTPGSCRNPEMTAGDEAASRGPGSALSAAAAAWANALLDGSRRRHRNGIGVFSTSTSSLAPLSLPRFLALAAALAAASAFLGCLAFWAISVTHEMSRSKPGGKAKGKEGKKKDKESCPGGVCPLPSLLVKTESGRLLMSFDAPPSAARVPRRPPPPTLEAPLDGIGGGGGRRASAESAFGGGTAAAGAGPSSSAAVGVVAGASKDDDESGGGAAGRIIDAPPFLTASLPRSMAAAAARALVMPRRTTTWNNNEEGGGASGGGGGEGTDVEAAVTTTTPATAPSVSENNSGGRARVSAPVADGEHCVRWPSDGSEYAGEWKNGLAHGRGVYAWPSGARYEGEWKLGLEEGVGTLLQPDGAAYCGFWRRGQLDGDGVYRPCGGGGVGGAAAAPAAAEAAAAAATPSGGGDDGGGGASAGQQQQNQPFPAPPPRADVIFLRRYARGVLLSETVLRVADYDAARAARGDARARAAARRAASKERAAAARAARPGTTIYKGHASYDLMRSLQMGVLFSTARVGEEALRGAGGGGGGGGGGGEATAPTAAATRLTPPASPLPASSSLLSSSTPTDAESAAASAAATAAATAAAAAASRRLAAARALTVADFEEQVEQAFPGFAGGGGDAPPPPLTPSSSSSSSNHLPTPTRHGSPPFKWKDYAPRAFDALRRAFGVDDGDYLVSLTGESSLRELPSPGKSGSVFFLSDDDRFLIKTVSKEEMHSLLRMLPEYVAHVTRPGNAAAASAGAGAVASSFAAAAASDGGKQQQQQPSTPPPPPQLPAAAAAAAPSLLTRFYGVHRVTPSGGAKVRFVVMGNVFPSDVVLHRRYDLKGSRHGRTAGAEALAKPNAVLKDLDLDLALALDARTHAELATALRADAAFLERLGLIDYSLLLGVHFGGWAPGCWRPPGAPAGSEAPLPPVRQLVVQGPRGPGAEKEKGGGGEVSAAAVAFAAAAPVASAAAAVPVTSYAAPRHSNVATAAGDGRRGARATGLALDELIDRLSMSPAAAATAAPGPDAAPSSSASASEPSPPRIAPSESWAKLRDSTPPLLSQQQQPANAAAAALSSLRVRLPSGKDKNEKQEEEIVLLSPLAAGPSTATVATATAGFRSRLVSGIQGAVAPDGGGGGGVPLVLTAGVSPGGGGAATAGTAASNNPGGAAFAAAAFGGSSLAPRLGMATRASALPRASPGLFGGGARGGLFSFSGGGERRRPSSAASAFSLSSSSPPLPEIPPPPTAASAVAAPAALTQGGVVGGGGGEPVLLFFGVIDFLQSYTVRKAAEHAVKAVAFASGDSMSVVNPRQYARRFNDAMARLFVVADEEVEEAAARAAEMAAARI